MYIFFIMRMEDLERKKLKELIVKSNVQQYIVKLIKDNDDQEAKKIMVALSNKIHLMSVINEPK